MEFEISKDLLKKKGYNMTTLAEKIGMSRGGLYTAIKNNTISLETIANISRVLDVHPSVLIKSEKFPLGIETRKEIVTDLESSFDSDIKLSELQTKYDALIKTNSLLEQLIESYNQRVLMLENKLFLLDTELYSLFEIAKPCVKALIKSEHPEFNTKRDPHAFLKYMDEDTLNNKIYTLTEIINGPPGMIRKRVLKLT
jgi:transcriptional regulator with XRE-family HTH domain